MTPVPAYGKSTLLIIFLLFHFHSLIKLIRKDKNGNTMAQEAFAQDPQCKVFLTTYGSSSHGIGLTAGRNVILAESHYNPAQISFFLFLFISLHFFVAVYL